VEAGELGVALTEFWIVLGEDTKDGRSLAYWGPYETREEAAASDMYSEGNETIIEIPKHDNA
jgi:hypothetical protein